MFECVCLCVPNPVWNKWLRDDLSILEREKSNEKKSKNMFLHNFLSWMLNKGNFALSEAKVPKIYASWDRVRKPIREKQM